MNKRDALEVGIKILGLYSLLSVFGSIHVIISAYTAESKLIENRPVYVLFSLLVLFLYLAFAIILLWRGKLIAEKLTGPSTSSVAGEQPALPTHAKLEFWVRVLGVYFFLSSIGQLVATMAEAGITIRNAFWWSRLVGEAFKLGVSLAFVFKGDYVANLIGRHYPLTSGTNN